MKGEVWDQRSMSEIVQMYISHQNNCINSFQISVASIDDVYALKTYGNPDGMNFSTVRIITQKNLLVFYAAVKVLCSSGVAPFGTDTLAALLAKHPILPPPVMPGSLPSEPPFVVNVDNVLGCIQSFPKGTSCGRDRLRAQHILDALCGEGSTIVVGLLKTISVVVNLLLEGRCPKVLTE
ncbi:hypothetical protein Tco_0100897, partial [Tanacetum coccineum]